jgi:iron(III) transport system ATP-binding protein
MSGGNLVDVLIRPDDTVHDDASPVQAKIMQKASRGADILYTLQLPGGSTALSLVPGHHNHAMGEKIGIRLEAEHAWHSTNLYHDQTPVPDQRR